MTMFFVCGCSGERLTGWTENGDTPGMLVQLIANSDSIESVTMYLTDPSFPGNTHNARQIPLSDMRISNHTVSFDAQLLPEMTRTYSLRLFEYDSNPVLAELAEAGGSPEFLHFVRDEYLPGR